MSGIVTQNVLGNSGLIKAVEAAGGAWAEIKTLTASSSATLSFVNGADNVVLDSTYPIYVFEFISLHPATDDSQFQFNFSVDTGSNYNVTKTTNLVKAHHSEGDTSDLAQDTGNDMQQSTSFANLCVSIDNDADSNISGKFWLFNPSSTTFAKHFLSDVQQVEHGSYAHRAFCGGYGNTTSAVDAIQFKMGSGNTDAGKIKLFGLKDS